MNWVVAGRGRLGSGGSVSFFQLGFQNLLPERIKTHKFEAFEKMDAEPGITAATATATMDFKLLALAVFTGTLMVAIFSGGPLRKMTIYGITHSILKTLCLLVGVLYIAWTLLYLVAWCFRLLFLLARIVRRNVPREGLADRLDAWLEEFEAKLDNGNDSSNPTTETVAASQSKSN